MFIDPNEGSAKDALAVTCSLDTENRISGNDISTSQIYCGFDTVAMTELSYTLSKSMSQYYLLRRPTP